MEKREDALREALHTNNDEITRWTKYQQENVQAVENLEMFAKRLFVDVMVPVGRKAYTAGVLIHTNEVMVGHYQGYFSQCSAHTAKQICEHRIRMAKEHLQKLQSEAEFLNNRLEKPYLEGVLANGEQMEIIEEYDEEKEQLWREEHKLRVKEYKMRERQERKQDQTKKEKAAKRAGKKSKATTTEDGEGDEENIIQMLEDSELMEEFQGELDKLQIEGDCDELLGKLMAGEMQLPPPKPRIAHTPKSSIQFCTSLLAPDNSHKQHYEQPKQEQPLMHGVVKKSQLPVDTSPPTNNNFHVNPELQALNIERVNDMDGSADSSPDDDDSDETPEEVLLIQQQAKFLPNADQIGFYHYQLQIIEQKLLTCAVNAKTIEEKLHLFKVRDQLEELLEFAEETEGAEELAAHSAGEDDEDVADADEKTTNKTKKQKKRKRITFALQNHTLEFRDNETVAEMLPKFEPPKPQRDVITLDDNAAALKKQQQQQEEEAQPKQPPLSKKQQILNKVAENLKYVAEHQSKQDFDLINKIIANAAGISRTLHIHFQHTPETVVVETAAAAAKSEATPEAPKIPATPADLYELIVPPTQTPQPTTLFIDAYVGEELVHAPALKEQDRKHAYTDPRMEFSNPSNKSSSSATATDAVVANAVNGTKSILRNKNAVEAETHLVQNIENEMNKANTGGKKKRKNKNKQKQRDNDECLSAYYKVMHDVVEKPLTEPEPLPTGKYINAHTPKKRVSRFKQMRAGADNT